MTNDGSYGSYAQQQAGRSTAAGGTAGRVSGAGANPGRDTFGAFYRSANANEERPPRPPHWAVTSRQKVDGGEMVGWRLTYTDLSAGYAQDVDLSDGGGANMGSGQWDVRKRGKATQQIATQTQTPAAPDEFMLVHNHWENRLVMLSGQQANNTMVIEATDDPTAGWVLNAVLYAPGANEKPLWAGPLTFKETTYFVIARIGPAPQAYASPGGAFVGLMDANLASCAGWMEMPVNVSPGAALKLFVTNTGDIFSMTSSQAYNAVPGLVGSAADRFKLPLWMHPLDVIPWGRGLRAFWKAPAYSPIGSAAVYDPLVHFHPRELNATGKFRRIRLPHCDVTGLDWDEAKIDELAYLTNATVWRNGLACTDDTNIIWKAGNGQYRRVYLNEQMPRLTNRKRVVVDFGDRGRDLIIRIDEIATNGATTPTTTYDVALNGNTWGLSPASEVVTLTGLTGRRSLAGVGPGGGMPIGQGTGWAHGHAAGKYYSHPTPPGGQSSWDLRGITPMNYGTPVTGTLPDTRLPEPFCYLTSTADAVLFKGYLPAGHTLTVDWGKSHEDGTVAASGAVATFSGPLNRASQRYPHTDNTGRFSDILGATFTGARDASASNATETIQLLSIAFEGHTLIPSGTDFSDYPRYLD